MKRATVSQAKNSLSALLADVRGGETVLVTLRGKAVAQIKPIDSDSLPDRAATELVEEGIANPPTARLDLPAFLAAPRPRLPEGYSASRLIADERSEER
jgi:antitoxin (DNA-binding transcriptional repressor) of toxin-antitoxin stability system